MVFRDCMFHGNFRSNCFVIGTVRAIWVNCCYIKVCQQHWMVAYHYHEDSMMAFYIATSYAWWHANNPLMHSDITRHRVMMHNDVIHRKIMTDCNILSSHIKPHIFEVIRTAQLQLFSKYLNGWIRQATLVLWLLGRWSTGAIGCHCAI